MAEDVESLRWVGEQHRMSGYCGRATSSTPPQARPADEDAAAAQPAPLKLSIAAEARTRVIRIGPRSPQPPADAGESAAAA